MGIITFAFSIAGGRRSSSRDMRSKRDAGLYYHLNGPDAVWPRGLQFQIEQTNVGDLIALYGFALDTWIDPKTRGDDQPTFRDPEKGGPAARPRRERDRLSEALAGRIRGRRVEHGRGDREGRLDDAHLERPGGEPGREGPVHRPREAGQRRSRSRRDGLRSRSRRPRSISEKSRSGIWNRLPPRQNRKIRKSFMFSGGQAEEIW